MSADSLHHKCTIVDSYRIAYDKLHEPAKGLRVVRKDEDALTLIGISCGMFLAINLHVDEDFLDPVGPSDGPFCSSRSMLALWYAYSVAHEVMHQRDISLNARRFVAVPLEN